MKKFLKLFLTVSTFMIIFTFSNVLAVTNVDVQINGEIVDFTDSEGNKVEAQIINDRTMVPLRKIFEILGCEINWDNDTRTVTATKLNKKIILQIDNKIARKIEDEVEEKISLDSAPVIVDGRTLVPLRFIAESLEKQVGWDKSTYTAIIIDYDYFADRIMQKNINLYHILSAKNNNISFVITREYNDEDNAKNNNIATLKGNVTQNSDIAQVALSFEGNNELIKEIISEGWGNIAYDVTYEANKIVMKTENETLINILGLKNSEFNEFETEKLALKGNVEDDLSKAICSIFNVDASKLNVSTFEKMKNDFAKFVNLFVINGTRDISYDNAKMEMFDYTKFDNVIYDNELSKTLSFINKKIFNYDVVQDELLYDWNHITYTINCENNTLILKITLENEYNEKVNYTITCKSN